MANVYGCTLNIRVELTNGDNMCDLDYADDVVFVRIRKA